MKTTNQRLEIGQFLEPFSLETLSHGEVSVPGIGLLHLQFRRFAGCPVCNLHLSHFARSIERLRVEGVATIAFFHSTPAEMRPFQGNLPFPVVADPDRRYYRAFGVERSMRAVLHPSVFASAAKGIFSVKSNPFVGGGDQTGLPADFLIDRTGEICALEYGRHADDQWSVDELVALAREHRAPRSDE